ncbi:phosphoglycerate mutase-like protein [Atractiella rhizophila]|nr:phosphoglycerate mutase-like protein [Atractiella rhizophila]
MSQVVGAVMLARHGDRRGFYQDPETYTAADTEVTPLGENQLFSVGQYMRSVYLNASSPSYIQGGISTGLYDEDQVQVSADGGGEGTTIIDSTSAWMQGMWPPTGSSQIILANGTTITSPLSGYQYVSVVTVEPEEVISLEGWTSCPAFTKHTNAVYDSANFLQMSNDSAAFYNSLRDLLDGRPADLENGYNVFDYANVQSIHNSTFASLIATRDGDVTGSTLAQLRALANYHEGSLFSSPNLSDIGNIGGHTILAPILSDLNTFTNSSQPVRVSIKGISYKPFISLFNLTSATLSPSANPSWQFSGLGIVNYASQLVFELRRSNDAQYSVRMMFRNGTDGDLAQLNMFGDAGDTDYETFVSKLSPYKLESLSDWCSVCNQTSARGCDLVRASEGNDSPSISSGGKHYAVSPVGAGFIGAGVTLAVVCVAMAALLFLGVLGFGGRKAKTKVSHELCFGAR